MNSAFVIYTEYGDKLKRLTDDQVGKLIRIIFEYENTGEEPVIEDAVLGVAFDFIRTDIDKQHKKYQARVTAGKRSGEKRREAAANKTEQNRTELNKPEQTGTNLKNKKEKEKEKENIKENLKKEKQQPEQTEQPVILERFGQNPYAPDIQDVKEFIAVKHLAVNPDEFYAHYTGVGWKSGGSPITNWQSLAMAWDAKAKSRQGKRGQQSDSVTGSRFADMYLLEYGGKQNGY